MRKTLARMYASTRKAPLAVATALSMYAYELGDQRKFPEWPAPFDANQHAAHLIAGVTIGYSSRMLLNGYEITKNHSLPGALGITALAGTLFETPLSDLVWYRNTTHSTADILYTVIGGVAGALCVKRSR